MARGDGSTAAEGAGDGETSGKTEPALLTGVGRAGREPGALPCDSCSSCDNCCSDKPFGRLTPTPELNGSVGGAWERPWLPECLAFWARTHTANFAEAPRAASGECAVTVNVIRVLAACLGTGIMARSSTFWPPSSPPTAHVDRPWGWQTVKWGENLRGFADSWTLAEPLCPSVSQTHIAYRTCPPGRTTRWLFRD